MSWARAGSHRKTCQRTEEEGEGERDGQDEEALTFTVSRERGTATAKEWGQIKREKKPQSPRTPCLTPVIHWDTSFWPALIHDCSTRQLSTIQHEESPLTATRSAAIICMGDKLSCLKSIVLICRTLFWLLRTSLKLPECIIVLQCFLQHILSMLKTADHYPNLCCVLSGVIFSQQAAKKILYTAKQICVDMSNCCLSQHARTHTHLDMQIC